jgi:hypothetical protein
MIKPKLILFIITGLLLFSQCKKDNENWTYCVDCDINSWVGSYEGTGVYYSDVDGKTVNDIPTLVTIDSSSATILKTIITVENHFSTLFTINKTNDDYYVNVPGSSQSLALTLSKKGISYKLSGTVKIFHYQADTLFTDHSISFETFKISDN